MRREAEKGIKEPDWLSKTFAFSLTNHVAEFLYSLQVAGINEEGALTIGRGRIKLKLPAEIAHFHQITPHFILGNKTMNLNSKVKFSLAS